MTLNDLHEMAFKAGEWKDEFTAAQLTAAFDGAKIVTKLEGGNYQIKQKDLQFALYKDEKFLAFASIKPVEIAGRSYDNVFLFYTPKENRRMGYSTVLLYGLKELRKNPLLFDGPIFNNGWDFLKNIATTHSNQFQSVKTLNKNTGDITDFSGAKPKKHEAYIVENDEFGFYQDCGAPFGKVYFNMFSEVLKD